MRIHPLVRFALAICPRDYRREYENSIAADMRTRGEKPISVAADLCIQGVTMRLESLWRDIAFAARTLRKSPMYTLVVVLAIAIAIAANVAVVSVLEGVLLRPLPYANAAQLVHPEYDIGVGAFSYLDAKDAAKQTTSFSAFGVNTPDAKTLTGLQRALSLNGQTVNAGYFQVVGARAQIGRLFTSSDLGKNEVVISDKLWRQYFDADPSVVGRAITLDGTSYRVAGVMQPRFEDITSAGLVQDDYWLPVDPHDPASLQRGMAQFDAWALLRPGVSATAARADLQRVMSQIVARYRTNHETYRRSSIVTAYDLIVGPVRSLLWLLYGAVTLLLIIACANVVNLTLVRAAARDRELVVRTALGASRMRIAGQLCIEMALLAAVAGAVGLALGWAALRLFDALGTDMIPRWNGVHVDVGVVLYVCGLLLVTCLVTGIVPALSGRGDLTSGLKAAGRSGDLSGSKRLRTALVIAEIALTFGIVTSAGLVVRSFVTLTHVDLGFNANNLYEIYAPSLPKTQYKTYASQLAALDQVVGALKALPNVTGAASTTVVPFDGTFIVDTSIPGRAGNFPVDGNAVAPGYFGVMGIPMLRGRNFTPGDGPHSQSVTIVNATLARQFFGTLDVIGKHIHPGVASSETPSETRTIVGVVADTRNGFNKKIDPEFYLPQTQFEGLGMIAVRTNGHDTGFAQEVQRAYAGVSPLFAAPRIVSYNHLFEQNAGRWQAAAMLFGCLALIALALALAGIYAVTAYSVEQRTAEFGIRKAIGARESSVLMDVVRGAVLYAAIGIVLGLLITATSTHLLSSLLFHTSSIDPLTFIAVIALLVGCAALAAFVPALRAMRVQPATALRYE